MDRRKDTDVRSGVERGTRVSDPLGTNRRSQAHGAEGLRQSCLIPPPWLGWGVQAGPNGGAPASMVAG
jgi:hypothetical protein